MSEKRRTAHRGEVLGTERITPHMIRVTLGGAGLSAFDCGDFTDHYVKLLFPRPGVSYPEPFDMARIRAELPSDQWPVTRTYTVRSWDADRRRLAIDFVYHGDRGLAGPWAASVRPGEEILFMGPGGAYAPDAEADWHLLAGDESALPAIATGLERIGAGVPAYAFVEVAGPDEEQLLSTQAKAEIVWVHRGDRTPGEALAEAVRGFAFPAGQLHAFVHGEAAMVKDLRRFLRVDKDIPMSRLSISGYWRIGRDEDGWQSSKRDWNRQVEEEEAAALSA
ncbi:siderophore-interacting protein [Fodinicola acaciae]|uniref:siderophore-interacting protein n=1 Tax=Fodinicola acaciae TaxID=2681555 RepID=UPI0013D8226C|nr:siderophore-interacting protein [Fodinicola acaciae]